MTADCRHFYISPVGARIDTVEHCLYYGGLWYDVCFACGRVNAGSGTLEAGDPFRYGFTDWLPFAEFFEGGEVKDADPPPPNAWAIFAFLAGDDEERASAQREEGHGVHGAGCR